MHFVHILLFLVADVMIEFKVVFLRDLFFISSPNCLYKVDSLSVDSNRVVYKVRVFLNNSVDFILLNEFVLAILHMHYYFGSSLECIVNHL